MTPAEIPFLSATELASAIRAGDLSPVAAVDAYLERIAAVGHRLNAYITVCADEARAQARRLESEAAAGHWRGPLHGVPVGVKDQIHTAGIRTAPHTDDGPTVSASFHTGKMRQFLTDASLTMRCGSCNVAANGSTSGAGDYAAR